MGRVSALIAPEGPSPATKDLRNRHLDFYLALTARAEAESHESQAAWAEALEADLDNLRAALGWAFESGQAAKALDLAAAIAPYCFEWWGRWSEGRRWLERALAAADGANKEQRANALSRLARLAHMQGDYSSSSAQYREAAGLYQEAGKDLEAATALTWLGWNLWYEDRSREAIPILEDAISVLRSHQTPRPLALALSGLAWHHISQGNTPNAIRLHEEAIQVLRDAGDKAFLADRLLSQANMYTQIGDPGEAMRFYSEMISILRELGDKVELVKSLSWAADTALMAGSLSEAKSMYHEQLHLATQLGDRSAISDARSGLARIAWAGGDFESACKLYTDAIADIFEVDEPSYIELGLRADHLRELGILLHCLGRGGEAKKHLLEAVAIGRDARSAFYTKRQAIALERLAMIGEEEGDLEMAVALRQEVVDGFRDFNEASSWRSVAESNLLRTKGDYEGALSVLERALQEAKDADPKYLHARLYCALGQFLFESGRARDAAVRLEEGASAAKTESIWDISPLLELLAAAAASAGDLDRALEVLRQLGWRINVVGPSPRIAETLAKIKAGLGEWETAARLIGAAETLRRRISRPVPEWEREAHESCVTNVRTAFGPAAFQRAVDQGREAGAVREIEEALRE